MKSFLSAAFALVALSTHLDAAPIDPFALYTFENGLLTDDSGNGNTGTNIGNAASLSLGNGFDGGTAASFSAVAGLSGIDTGIDINRGVIGSMTMGAWVNYSSIGPSSRGGKILSHDNGGFDRSVGIDDRGDDAGQGFVAFTGNGVADAPGTFPLDTWAHLAVVYDGADSKLFVNGSVVETFTEATFANDSGFSLFIGTVPGFNEDFVGLADDVFVYDRALTNAEVLDITTNGFPAPVPLPAGLPLLLVGIGAFGVARKNRA